MFTVVSHVALTFTCGDIPGCCVDRHSSVEHLSPELLGQLSHG